MSHKKFGPDRFSRFDVYWIQTNRQTDKANLYIDSTMITLEHVHYEIHDEVSNNDKVHNSFIK